MSVTYCKNHSRHGIWDACPGCMAATIATLREEVAGLKAEVERLKSKVNPCPFCSSFYELDASHQLLKDGVASLKSRAESAEAKLEKVRNWKKKVASFKPISLFLEHQLAALKAIIGEVKP